MKTETEIETQETEGEGTLPPSEGHKMQTYSRLIDEPDSDKLSRIESVLDQISAKLGDEDEYESLLAHSQPPPQTNTTSQPSYPQKPSNPQTFKP